MNFLDCCSCTTTYSDKMALSVFFGVVAGMIAAVLVILIKTGRELRREEEDLFTR